MDIPSGDYCYTSAVGLVCRIGDLQRLNNLLAERAPIDHPDNRGWYPIHEGAFSNHVDCLQALFETENPNLNVNWRSHDGSTALLLASKKGHLDTVNFLLQHDADPNLGSSDELRPLLAATKCSSISCVDALLNVGADVSSPYWNNWTALHEAVSHNHLPIIRLLLTRNADPFASDDEGLTSAFVACQYGHWRCLEILIGSVEDKNSLVNSRAHNGASCLYISAQEGYDVCVDILIKNGADVNVCTKDNIHPICVAAKMNYTRCANLMLPRIDKNIVFYSMEDPVFVAVEERRLEMLILLLEAGFPCERLTDYFRDFAVPIYRYLQPLLVKTAATPLACAVAKTNVDAVKILLRFKAKTTATNSKAYSPLLLAILKRRVPEILLELLKADSVNLNLCNVDSICRIPDALLVAVHPLYRGQLTAMLRVGLNPSLSYWCGCKQPKKSEYDDDGSLNYMQYKFLNELCGLLLPNELADLLGTLLPFSSCGLPNCCQAWVEALGPRISDFEDWRATPPLLTHSCRIVIRNRITSSRLSSDDWVDSLPCSPTIKNYLIHKGPA